MLKINNIVVGKECFPNKEKVIRAIEESESVLNFLLEYESDEDLFLMIVYANMYKNTPKTLSIPYFPYERADRLVDNKLPTLFTIIDIVNSCDFKSVYISDPHNKSAFSSLNNVLFTFPTEDWKRIIEKHEIDTVCFPDDGAYCRYSSLMLYFPSDIKFITAKKVRDEVSGKIKALNLTSTPTPKSKVLIIDDLCSKGGTFVLTANKLKDCGVEEVYLFTSHCERSVYDGDLIKYGSPISKFYTKSPFLHGNDILNLI